MTMTRDTDDGALRNLRLRKPLFSRQAVFFLLYLRLIKRAASDISTIANAKSVS
jgi:hypothetical protein